MASIDIVRTRSPDSVILSRNPVIVVVDPVSTGACLAHHMASQGQRLIRVWSDACPDGIKQHTKAGLEVDWLATIQYTSVASVVAAVAKLGTPVADVMVGCETGVLCADLLVEGFGVRGNGLAKSSARRNKAEQSALVRSAGLDAPIEHLATTAADVEAFLSQHTFPSPFRAVRPREKPLPHLSPLTLVVHLTAHPRPRPRPQVVKPVEGAGSDGVTICNSPDEVRTAFSTLEGTKNVLGLHNYAVLLQEYLKGEEVRSPSPEGPCLRPMC